VNPGRARPADDLLLGLRPSEVPGEVRFTLAPHLCRIDGRLYGGTALAVALAAAEIATGRPALWATTQLVGTTAVGSEVVVTTTEVARGRSTSQVQVDVRVDGRLISTGVGATAEAIPDGLAGIGPRMPVVPPPEDCPVMWGPDTAPWFVGPDDPPGTGQHHACEFRIATWGDSPTDRKALWSRLVPPTADRDAPITPAGLGFVGDMVPLAVTAACGARGGGTSIDQTLRLGEPARHPWVLLDIEAEVAHGGFGHGRAVMWSPDARVVGVASQTARLITFDMPPSTAPR
jgi:acyl-CoA thioesterase